MFPGVTRDRVSYDANWNGRSFVVVDTGGWAPDAKGMAAQIAEQVELAISAADAVVFVVDATVGTQDVDEAVVQVLRRSNKPVVLAANKVDDQRTEARSGDDVEPRTGRAVRRVCPCTAGGVGTCSTRSWPLCRRRRANLRKPNTVHDASPSSASPMSESRACSTSSPVNSGWWWTMSPEPRWIRLTNW